MKKEEEKKEKKNCLTFIFIQVLLIHHTNLQTFYSTQLWHKICKRFKIVETTYQNQFCLNSNDFGFVYDGVGIGETTQD